MTKEEILGLTKGLYRLTLLFPKKEPLRYKMREVGADLLADVVALEEGGFSESSFSRDLFGQAERNFEVLKSFFEIAKEQNWVKKEDLLNLAQRYENIKGEFREKWRRQREKAERVPSLLRPERGPSPLRPLRQEKIQEVPSDLDKRQRKVLNIIQQKKEVQISELSKRFPQVSRRTLLRDLEKLCQKGLVKREGEGRGAYYRPQSGERRKSSLNYEKYLEEDLKAAKAKEE